MVNWLNVTFASFDKTLLTYFHTLAEKYGTVLTPLSKVLAVTCDLPLLLIGWLGFVLFFVKKDKKCGMMMCGSVIIGAFLTTIVIKNIVYRPRPYIDSEIYKSWWELFKLKADWDTSFPSGHACAATAGVTAYFIWTKKKSIAWLAFLYPIIIAASRMYLCVHYPSDIIAGMIVGVISAFVCIPCVKLIYYLIYKFPNNFFSRYCLTGSFKKQDK